MRIGLRRISAPAEISADDDAIVVHIMDDQAAIVTRLRRGHRVMVNSVLAWSAIDEARALRLARCVARAVRASTIYVNVAAAAEVLWSASVPLAYPNRRNYINIGSVSWRICECSELRGASQHALQSHAQRQLCIPANSST